jgi:serine/threonine-protein kinase RsbW
LFNPLSIAPPNLTSPLEDRPIGGLGIHLVRSFMNEIYYSDCDGSNQLVMSRKVRVVA